MLKEHLTPFLMISYLIKLLMLYLILVGEFYISGMKELLLKYD